MSVSRDVLQRLNDTVKNNSNLRFPVAGPYISEYSTRWSLLTIRSDKGFGVLWYVVQQGSYLFGSLSVGDDRHVAVGRHITEGYNYLMGSSGSFVDYDWNNPDRYGFRWDTPHPPMVLAMGFRMVDFWRRWVKGFQGAPKEEPFDLLVNQSSNHPDVVKILANSRISRLPYRSINKRWNVDAGNFKYKQLTA